MSIFIIGLGPGPRSLLTLEASEALESAQDKLYVRTAGHPALAGLEGRVAVHSLDPLLKKYGDAAPEAIAEELLRAHGVGGEVRYAVPGDPTVGDATVDELVGRCRRSGIAYRIVHGLSALKMASDALHIEPLAQGLQIADAIRPDVSPQRPSLFLNVNGRQGAARLQRALLHLFPSEHMGNVVNLTGGVVSEVALGSLLDLNGWDDSTCLYLQRLPLTSDLKSMEGMKALVAHLRGPEGCPWDREQTHASLKRFLLEETYEALEALDEGDLERLQEELGDILLQILMHAQIGEEKGEFDLSDVVGAISRKLVRRHPHVFGEETVSNAEEVAHRWHAIKKEERLGEGSVLEGVPQAMPALAYSQALLSRAAREGFQWPGLEDVLEKLGEELREMAESSDGEERLEELGDVLINVANAARYLGMDAEDALRRASRKFRSRFMEVERLSKERGLTIRDMSPIELQDIWKEAKTRAG